jgi:hypothetical protein
MAPADNTVARTLHDLGLAAWFGGSLMGAAGLNGAAAVVEDPTQRLRVANSGWAWWTPLNLAGIAAHLAGGAVLTGANKGRLAGQQGVATASTLKTALTVAALGVTGYARALGRKLERAGDVPVEGGTSPNPATPKDVVRAQRQLTALQWLIPVLTGAVLVVNARMVSSSAPLRSPRAWWGGCSRVASRPPAVLGVASWGLKVAVGVPVRAGGQVRLARPMLGPGQHPQGGRQKDSLEEQAGGG